MSLKRDLSLECRRIKNLFDNNIKNHRHRLQTAILKTSKFEVEKQELKLLIEKLQRIQVELNENFEILREYVDRREFETHQNINMFSIAFADAQQGLTALDDQDLDVFEANLKVKLESFHEHIQNYLLFKKEF